MREKFLQSYARWVTRHPLGIAVGAFLASVLGLTLSFLFLKTQTGILDLYSEKEPVAQRFMKYVEKFGAAETLVVVVEKGDETQRRQALDELAQRLRKDPHHYIKDILYKIDLQLFKEHAFQFLKEEDARELLKEARRPNGGIRMFFEARDFNDYLKFMNRSLEAGLNNPKLPKGDFVKQFGQGLAPLFLLRDYLEGENLPPEAMTTRVQGEAEERATIDDLGYFRTDDKKMHIMLVTPSDPKQDYRVAQKLVEFVRDQIAQVKKDFPQVKIGVTGGPALNNDQFKASERDMTLASAFAFISTGIIFILAFKSFGRPFLGLLTLALSLTWAFGLTTVTVGHLNMFSLAFVVILVGQGTYYGVHVVARYEEELIKGRSVPQAIQNTIQNIFGNITTSTITTSSAFFATMLVPLKGFAELGWIAGSGIILSSLGMQMVLPAFLLIYDRNGPRGNLSKQRQSIFGGPLKDQWVHFVKNLITKDAPYIMALVLVASAWGAYLFFSPRHGVPFDSNILNLQAKGTEAVDYEKKLIETSLSPRAGIFLTRSLAQAQDFARRAQELPTVQRVEWIGEVLPEGTIQSQTHGRLRNTIRRLPQGKLRAPNLTQLEKNLHRLEGNLEKISELALNYPQGHTLLEKTEEGIEAIQEIFQKLPHEGEGTDQETQAMLGENFFLPEIVEFQNRLFHSIRRVFQKSAEAEKLELNGVPPEIVSRFISADNTYAIYAFPSVNIWEKKPLDEFVKDLRSVDNDVTGPPVMFEEILSLVRNSYFKAAGFSALAILIIFLIDFKSLRYTLLAFLPLILGVFSMFGLMSFFNLSFNTANMIALPMILGIGADNGVHLIHRFREEHESNIDFLFQSTGKALLITYLDTLTSFVGLALAAHQGLAQLGRVVILGITCCTVAGILFLPSVMTLIIKHRVRKNS
jgi:hopanoid biosynthesis associated RND transporter like protein HpnN